MRDILMEFLGCIIGAFCIVLHLEPLSLFWVVVGGVVLIWSGIDLVIAIKEEYIK